MSAGRRRQRRHRTGSTGASVSFLAEVQRAAQGVASVRGHRAARPAPALAATGSDGYWRGGRPLRLQDPTGHSVALPKRLGKGHATTAYLGADGWVYLFTSHEARDPAKEVLESVVARGKSKHLPGIEFIGHTRDASIWRMPVYQAATGDVSKQARLLAKCAAEAYTAAGKRGWGAWNDRGQRARRLTEARRDTLACAAKLAKAKKIPGAVVPALRRLADATENYSESWLFEFPPRNVMQDAKGNLILLDVIFDQQALLDYRRRKLARTRGY